MNAGLVPNKSTVYVSNLPFSLTNSDLYQLMENYGKVSKVTIVKDKDTRLSKGVAFVLYIKEEDAINAVNNLDNKELFGRSVKCSIAKDNGRASEFSRKNKYTEKVRCYECGEFGHLSYKCPKNVLGARDVPKKKKKKKKSNDDTGQNEKCDDDSEVLEDWASESLASAISYEKSLADKNNQVTNVANKKKIKKNDYFSDEEEIYDEHNE